MKNSINTGKCLLFMVLLITSNVLFGQQGGITGTVTDKNTNEPIPFANVTLYQNGSLTSGATTDIHGWYLLKAGSGIYDVKVQFIGYKEKVAKKIHIKDSVITLNFKMEGSVELMDKIEVVEERAPSVSADAAYYSVTVADGTPARATGKKRSFREAKVDGDMAGDVAEVMVAGVATTTNAVPVQHAGILTAGEVNDFSKWKLWQDVATTDLSQWQKYWQFVPLDRYSLQVETVEGRPVIDARVSLVSSNGNGIWSSRTDNTGKAELWTDIFKEEKKKGDITLTVDYKGQSWHSKNCMEFSQGINIIKIPASCDIPKNIDVMFTVDATSSMGDELDYLKDEILDIIQQTKNKYPGYKINLGCVFYRDIGDEYVTKKFDFTTKIEDVVSFIKEQSANGGGDRPEAVDQALNMAVNECKWSEDAVSRIMFLVLDAPPHYRPEAIASVQQSIEAAARKGIRIVPVAGSGIEKSDEYLFRAFALATNGTYVFLTDHSGVGGPHIKPTTDEYDVVLLNELLIKLIYNYSYVPPCDEVIIAPDIKDTMVVYNPKLVAHEIADAGRVGKYSKDKNPKEHIENLGDTATAVVDTVPVINGDSLAAIKSQAIKDSIDKEKNITRLEFHNFKYYPNPTVGNLTIEFDGEVKEIYLADITGKLLEKYSVEGTSLKIDISKYPVGVYFLQYFYQEKWLMGKVVKIK